MGNIFSNRQSKQASNLPFITGLANSTTDTIISAVDAAFEKVYEDRNIFLTGGGLVTYTGTALQFTESLELTLNQNPNSDVPLNISIGTTTKNFPNNGDLWYVTLTRVQRTSTTTVGPTNGSNSITVTSVSTLVIGDSISGVGIPNNTTITNISGLVVTMSKNATSGSTGSGTRIIFSRVNQSNVLPVDQALNAPSATTQETFVIAKRIDAADGTKRIYWRNGMGQNEGQTLRLGASGSGSGSGGAGDDLNSLRFKASFFDTFAENKTGNTSAVNNTDSNATYSAANAMYQMSYDASKTVTGTGTAMTLSATPAFTIVAGDMLVVGTEARKITVVTSQTVYTIEAAFSSNPTAAQATVSQAVHTNDVRAHTENSTGLAINAVISDAVSTYMLWYKDTAAVNDIVWDYPAAAVVAFSATADNSSWSSKSTRPAALSTDESIRTLPTTGSQFKARFFANATSGSGSVNLLEYKVFLHEESASASGSASSQAKARTDAAGTAVNCSVSSSTGKTRITTTFTFGSEIQVFLDGKKLPEFVDATITPDGYFTRVNGSVIELDSDYSGAGLQIEVLIPVGTVDNTNLNSTNISLLQDNMKVGFQGFIDESSKLTAINGAPSSGQFRSNITGRSQINDLANDLRARMGIDRVTIQQSIEIQNEFGPNGERVFGALNDDRNLIRFVGAWINEVDSEGYRVNTTTVNSYVEVVFYGTGINLIGFTGPFARTWQINIDGSDTTTAGTTASYSSILGNRKYSPNNPISLASGLTLGLHTLKLTMTVGELRVHGFEILNESSLVKVQPGTSYVNGKKLVSSSQYAVAYNAGTYDSILRDGAVVGSLNTRGNRTLVYQKSDGTIGKSAIEVNSAQGNLGSADHTNEEIARKYYPREFGAGRSDDFSLGNAVGGYGFTLDDGTTSLVMQNGNVTTSANGYQALIQSYTGTQFMTFTFVGTGLDLQTIVTSGTPTQSFTAYIDGVQITTTLSSSDALSTIKNTKIVSGLPYGTHVFKMAKNSTGNDLAIIAFIVYQPKKPTLPAGAVELADYNVMANYDGSNITGTAITDHQQIPSGVIYKPCTREFVYVGANWSIGTMGTGAPNEPGGVETSTLLNNNQPASYTFFGTGAVIVLASSGLGTYTFSVSIDGALNASGVAKSNASNGGGGTYTSTSGSSGLPCRVEFTGLALGVHTISFQRTGGAGNFSVGGLHIITPIHSPRSNFQADLQNTLPVGSCGISDNRRLSPVKSEDPKKFRAQAVGVSSNPSTSSTSPIPMPDMSITAKSNGSWFALSYNVDVDNSAQNNSNLQLYVDGVAVGVIKFRYATGGIQTLISDRVLVYLSTGIHKVDVYWWVNAGTANSQGPNGNSRSLTVEEL